MIYNMYEYVTGAVERAGFGYAYLPAGCVDYT